jgi:broad specificity phosphatase PhoE
LSLLTVVRHGQASFLAANYDQLSETGERQARLLGEHWLRAGARFHEVHTGPAERQIRTAEIAGAVLRAAGERWPEVVVHPELDEFPAEAVLRRFTPPLAALHAEVAEGVAAFQAAADFAAKQRSFDRLLREVSRRWLAGEVSAPDIPSWQDFCHGVEAAVRRITDAAPKSAQVAVFTSGGPTAATARVALGLTYEATLDLTWSPRNASYSEFLFTPGRFSLSTFNLTPHLAADPALLTYR